MANVKPSAFGTAITPAATTILTGETAGGTAGRFTVSQLTGIDSEGVGYLAPYTGSASRTVEDKLAGVVSANDFSGTATQKIHAAAAACAGTNNTLLIPTGTWTCSALDLTEVKHIVCEGVIKSTVAASGIAVLVGTAVDTANRMIFGDISLYVEHSNNVNTGLTGTVGILIRGAAQCRFRLRSAYFDIGVSLAPQTGTGTQYISDCHFTAVDVYGCRIGLDINGNYGVGDDMGWVNECHFDRVSVNPAGNVLGADTGIQMRGNYSSNNHVFMKPHVEGCTCPIRLTNASNNLFLWPRLEAAGNIVFGDGTTTPVCGFNTIIAGYNQGEHSLPSWTMDAWAPNFIGAHGGVSWTTEMEVGYDGWINNGTSYYYRNLYNSFGLGKVWTSVTLNSGTRSFNFAGGDKGNIVCRASKGDIFRITAAWNGTPGVGDIVTVRARNSSMGFLADLSSGAIPYLGTGQLSSFANATSGLVAFKDLNYTLYADWRYVSVNRSDIFYVFFEMNASVDWKFFRVERMVSTLTTCRLCATPVA